MAVYLLDRDKTKMLGAEGVVAVADREVTVIKIKDDRLVHPGELSEAWRRRTVRQEHAVHHEVAVMHHFAEVTSVAVELDAIRSARQQPMITPLPDEAAMEPRIAL